MFTQIYVPFVDPTEARDAVPSREIPEATAPLWAEGSLADAAIGKETVKRMTLPDRILDIPPPPALHTD